MRLIDETEYQELLAKIPMEERTFRKAVEVAENMPTIDAVPVVRCRDCKYYRIHHGSWGEDIPHCIKAWGGAEVDPMDFCSYGERKDGE